MVNTNTRHYLHQDNGKYKYTPAKRSYECNKLHRFPALKTQTTRAKEKQQQAPWICSKARQQAIDAFTLLLGKPSSWPDISVMFEYDGKMKTAEALLKCGPVGAYLYQWLDCDPDYRDTFIELKKVFEVAMRKVSTQKIAFTSR